MKVLLLNKKFVIYGNDREKSIIIREYSGWQIPVPYHC